MWAILEPFNHDKLYLIYWCLYYEEACTICSQATQMIKNWQQSLDKKMVQFAPGYQSYEHSMQWIWS